MAVSNVNTQVYLSSHRHIYGLSHRHCRTTALGGPMKLIVAGVILASLMGCTENHAFIENPKTAFISEQCNPKGYCSSGKPAEWVLN